MESLQHHEDVSSSIDATLMSYSNSCQSVNSTHLVPGTAAGHVIAGSSFVIIGLLYVIAAQHRYYFCLRTSTKFVSGVEIPFEVLSGRFKKWPLLAILKIYLGGSYLAMELITATFRKPGGNETPYWQHDIMAASFMISGFVDIFSVQHRKRNGKRMQLIPDGFEYVVFALAFGLQAMLLISHLHKRTPLDVRVHHFYALVAVCCFLVVLAEGMFRRHPLMPVMRGYFIMMQGTWLINLLIVLYHPGVEERVYDLYDDKSIALVSLMFVYHVILNMVLVLTINLFFVWVYSRQTYKIVPPLKNGHGLKGAWDCEVATKHRNENLLNDGDNEDNQSETFIDFDNQSENEFEMMEPTKIRKP
ncbi:transmembrane protein 45b [Plakobranchus ocellatus]|uniref:Transmembrane protein 45b n=1 Tax=Plakobranchus ocellatus TaxID=259542 RepID=A0AAV3Y6N5_9GAST|nr:transmembrane protein 45b [Plakobranchus ocellatus]